SFAKARASTGISIYRLLLVQRLLLLVAIVSAKEESPSPAGANQVSTTEKSQPPASTASIAQATSQQQQQSQKQPCIHSTPLATVATGMASSGARSDKSNKKKHPAAAAAASTVPKSAAAAAADSADDDEDCVITSIEEPKSVADIISPCKYLSPDWLNDIKTSSQSLKSYMQRVETEENLKMQYWAKRREADERDLVARVTRNLKLAERELPVLPYQYEEPPPTPPPAADEEEEEFPDLTEAQLQLVERAWSRQLPSSEVLDEGFSLRVTREELRSLAGLNWLNDNIVNFYMQLIAARSADEQLGLPKVHAFSTFFYTKLSSSGYASVRRWTRKPVNGRRRQLLALMRQYLADEHRDKKSGTALPDLSDYQLIRETGAPQQENGSDCGVFTCKFADYYCKQKDFTFSQDNMPYFRKRITVEIMEKRLLW
uniref:ULP_PROTEASE domain-containing protein n=1 Tax=Macrostomum lignano TaxID=282301 RepID=A0A1I8HUU4_9PLAT